MRIRLPQYAPPGGVYFYEVPQTKRAFSNPSLIGLEREVVAHLIASKLEVPLTLRAQIEHYMCERLPDGLCDGEGGKAPGYQRQPNYFNVLAALPKYLHGPLASPKEAETRATVCRACPRNNLSLCTTCNDLKDQALRYVGRRQVMQLRYMGVCTSYGVPSYALVWIKSPTEVAELPAECWAAVKQGVSPDA
jgi:hypothetical protein